VRAARQERPLGGVAGERERPFVGLRGRLTGAEPAQQVGPRGVEVVVARERIDAREAARDASSSACRPRTSASSGISSAITAARRIASAHSDRRTWVSPVLAA
jgi:hypothetical protein